MYNKEQHDEQMLCEKEVRLDEGLPICGFSSNILNQIKSNSAGLLFCFKGVCFLKGGGDYIENELNKIQDYI